MQARVCTRVQGCGGSRWFTKAELLQDGIIFLIHLFARASLLMKMLNIEATFKTDIIKVVLVF